MILKSMTATFGKLEGETLTLTPGLNLITAPNEWGKSTWCAFLLAMLYGVDTAQRASRGIIPDKERYKPWSGRPMEGRIDLVWQGRDITIQRTSRGRQIMGEFQAFETESGLPVPELNKDNCGLMLLGVERPVYQRSGFIRQAELPVTQDEQLSRRLNALVTTGNENTAGPQLEKQLRDLQNRCQHNKTGLLPQARAELAEIQADLEQLDALALAQARLEGQLATLNREQAALNRHQAALDAQAAREKRQALAQARQAQAAARQRAENLAEQCKALPSQTEAECAVRELRALSQEIQVWNLDAAMLDELPAAPTPPPALAGQEDPLTAARMDEARYTRLSRQKPGRKAPVFVIFSVLLALCAGVFLLTPWANLGVVGGDGKTAFFASAGVWLCLGLGIAAIAALVAGLILVGKKNRAYAGAQAEMEEILKSYGVSHINDLIPTTERYLQTKANYDQAARRQADTRSALDARRAELAQKTDALAAPFGTPAAALAHYLDALDIWDSLGEAQRALAQANQHVTAMETMAKDLPAPDFDPQDHLTLTGAETAAQLTENQRTAARLRSQLDQSRGRTLALGDAARLNAQAEALKARIGQLEDYYAALGYAQAALKTAGDDLRQRFAPKITAQAREILRDLTGGRYTHLLWDADFSLSAGTEEETVLQKALRRSDGTIDQMYLALRLAVCREILGENAPIVLDDALVRFDDKRMAAALKVLRKEGENRQILLFSCQSREQAALENL